MYFVRSTFFKYMLLSKRGGIWDTHFFSLEYTCWLHTSSGALTLKKKEKQITLMEIENEQEGQALLEKKMNTGNENRTKE